MVLFKSFIIAFALLFLVAGGFVLSEPVSAQQEKTATATPTPTPPVNEEDEEIKVDTEVVNVLFTAQDKDRRLLTGLKQEDIRIFEDGKPQEISAFARQIDLPLNLAILIDTSVSQQRTLPEEKAAAISFLEAVVRPSKDEVAIVSFTGESTLEQGMTNNLTRLRRSIDKVEFVPPAGYIGGGVMAPGTPPISPAGTQIQGSTAIWDSIWITSEEVLKPAPDKIKRVIILLSDGDDTSSRKKIDEALRAAQKAEAVVYSIGVGDDFYAGVLEGPLKKISEGTGGRAFFPKDEVELRQAFKKIEEELRSQYLIAYEPNNQLLDGSYRKIEIQLASPELEKQKVKLTHRQGYFARNANKK